MEDIIRSEENQFNTADRVREFGIPNKNYIVRKPKDKKAIYSLKMPKVESKAKINRYL